MYRYLLDIPLWGDTRLRIPAYGTLLALGAVTGIWLAARRAKAAGFKKETVVDMGVLMVLWGVVGARLLFVIENWGYFFSGGRMWEILALWKGGLVFYGGFIAAVLYAVYHFLWGAGKEDSRRLGDFWDLAAPSTAIALGFTRLGCFMNGCCYGRPTDCPLVVRYPPGSIFHNEIQDAGTWVHQHYYDMARESGMLSGNAWSLPVHPTQLYSSIFGFMLGGALYWYWTRKKGRGEIGALLLLCYSAFRFTIEFIRINPPVFSWAPLAISQWISIPGFLFALWLLLVSRGVLRSPVGWLGPVEGKEGAASPSQNTSGET